MAKRLFSLLALGVCAMIPASLAAQERVPHAGTAAVGFEVGAFLPADAALDNSLLVGGLFEYYVTPRVSLRTDVGWASPGLSREPADSLRQLPLRLDVNYNWEGGNWHPFVGAGIGAYVLQVKDNGHAFGESQTKAGFSLGGGVERFIAPTLALKGEVRYHRVNRTTTGRDPSGVSLTAGVKRYF